jgi:hypothetical protein
MKPLVYGTRDIEYPGWGDTLHNTATWYSAQPRFKCGRPLPIYSALTMGAGHYSRPPGERLLPRGKGPALQAFSMAELLRSHVQPSHKIVKAKRHGHIRLILALQFSADCELWCVFLCILQNFSEPW